MKAVAYLALIGLLALACGGAPATPAPTPTPTLAPTPSLAPTATPTAVPTPSPTAATHDITVKLSVTGQPFGSSQTLIGLSDTTCETRDGYSDVKVGMQAIIHDAANTVIGFATFTDVGQSTKTEQGPVSRVPTECTFTTVVQDVPDAPTYGVEVGTRGTVLFSRADLAGNNWTAQLVLGD